MKNSSILIVLISFLYLSCRSQRPVFNGNISADLLYPDSTVKAFLGNDITRIIFTPDSVKCYTLNALTEPIDSTKTLAKYTINEFKGSVSNNYISILQFLIQQKESYLSDTLIKECKFTPQYAFDFHRKKKNAVVLISLDCEMWGFYHNNSLITKNIANPKMLENYIEKIE